MRELIENLVEGSKSDYGKLLDEVDAIHGALKKAEERSEKIVKKMPKDLRQKARELDEDKHKEVNG